SVVTQKTGPRYAMREESTRDLRDLESFMANNIRDWWERFGRCECSLCGAALGQRPVGSPAILASDEYHFHCDHRPRPPGQCPGATAPCHRISRHRTCFTEPP